MRRQWRAAMVLAAAASPFAGAAAAEPVVYTFAPVIVTATRTVQEAEDVPASVEVISQEEIAQTGAYNVRDALAAETNLLFNGSLYGGHNVIIRGMDTDKSLILINGRRVANEASAAGLGNAMALDRVNLFNVERIEIVRGPASALYGSEAMGGVINIITKTPEAPSLSTGAEINSEDRLNWWHADTGKIGKFSASFDAKFDKYRRDLIPADSYGNGNDTAQTYSAALQYAFSENSRVQAWADYFSEHMKSEGGGEGDFTSRDYRQENYGMSWDGKSPKNTWQVETYGSRFCWSGVTAAESYDFNRDQNRLWHLGARDTMRIGAHHRLTFGGEYEKNVIRGTGLGAAGDGVHTVWSEGHGKEASERSMDSWAAYAQDEMTYGKWVFIPAVRYDHHSEYGGHTSPKMGVTYRAGDHFRVKANYGEGFKAPGVMQLYYDMRMWMGPAGLVHLVGNPDLSSEESTSWDVGFETEFGRGYASLTYFDNDVTDLIDSRYQGREADGYSRYQYINVDRARIRGVESMLGWHVTDRLEAKVVSTWLDAEDATNHTDLPQRADFSQVYQLRYDDHRDTGWSAMLWDQLYADYAYVSTRTGPTVTAGKTSYNVLNLTVTRRFNKDSRIYGSVRNLLDREAENCDLDGRFWSVGIAHSF